jgi:outer membrane protein TolC
MVQANQVVSLAEGELKEAKGAFDPLLKGGVEQKELEGTKYYQLSEAGLVVPTWVGVNVKVGYAQSIGSYVNAMDQMPNNGLLLAGLEVPIGQGLFYDKRRASVNKAQVYMNLAGSERQLMINEILFDASVDYWYWFEKHHQLQALEVLLTKSKERLDNTIRSAELGDKPFIDTLEASIQYQSFKSLFLDLETAEQNAREYVNVHLWADGLVPLQLDEGVVPESLDATVVDLSQWSISNDTLVSNHPKLAVVSSKINLNEIELRLAKESLKPKLNLNYNLLNEPVGGDVIGFNANDYKVGLELSVPIFVRSARGQVQKEKAEVLMAKSDYEFAEEKLKANFKVIVNKSENALQQAELLADVVLKYRELVAAEQKLFNIGESSLMMLNYREITLMENEIKWIEKVGKSKLAELEILYAIGQLN